MNFLCDTNIVSELARLKPNPGVVEWFAGVSSVALSAVTVEEIFYGLASKPKPAVQSWFEQFLDSRCRVLPITAQIAKRSGQMRGQLRSRAKTQNATRYDDSCYGRNLQPDFSNAQYPRF